MAKPGTGQGKKTLVTLDAIQQIAKAEGIPLAEVTRQKCNSLVQHQHKLKVSDGLFYHCRTRLIEESIKKDHQNGESRIRLEELPQLLTQARSLISRLGKEQAKKFIDVV